MPTELNRAAKIQLFAEDLEWLMQQPRTLERDHIADVLKAHIREYQSDRCPATGGAEHRCNICGGVVRYDGTPPQPGCWGHR
jgi:hypothetical protein